jgi:hypothetical protein
MMFGDQAVWVGAREHKSEMKSFENVEQSVSLCQLVSSYFVTERVTTECVS